MLLSALQLDFQWIHVYLSHQFIVDHPCLSTPGQNKVTSTPLEHYITFPTAGEKDPNEPISPNKARRKQILNSAGLKLQPYSKDLA